MRIIDLSFGTDGSVLAVFDVSNRTWLDNVIGVTFEFSPFNGNMSAMLTRTNMEDEIAIIRKIEWLVDPKKLYR